LIERLIKRAKLLWLFIKMANQGTTLEKEIQEAEQTMFNLKFASQLRSWDNDKELAFRIGYIEGIKWCMTRMKRGR
jgi:hypothetical protein